MIETPEQVRAWANHHEGVYAARHEQQMQQQREVKERLDRMSTRVFLMAIGGGGVGSFAGYVAAAQAFF